MIKQVTNMQDSSISADILAGVLACGHVRNLLGLLLTDLGLRLNSP
ncbi:MAG: hypothetical protein P8L66_12785 [Rhodospirillaceae bacterium]|nr:hypothetical protein [Rhodospirillaceae bacterium]